MREPSSQPRDERLDEILADYLEAQRQGRPPTPEELLAQHPEHEDELRSFLADRAHFARLAGPAAPPGDRIQYFGDYELLEEVARGGMGVVYRARQVSLNRLVALKMILAGQFASPDDVRRFHAEAEAAAQLDHPNIVPIYEVGEHDGHPYFTMKLISGPAGPLAGLVKGPRPSAKLVAAVARAVHHAHQRGILHRDLKPANVLIDSQGEPQVTDFGLAKHLAVDTTSPSPTRTGSIVGTPSYMAPEQARAVKGLTTAVDVYSLGAILYELLTSQPPFRAATPLDTVLQVLEREPPLPRTLNPLLDRDLETICLKCLEKDPQRRYGSAEALADDLERWLAGVPVQARRSSAWERTVKWARRRPAVAALLAVSCLILMAGVALGVWVSAQMRWERDRAEEQRADAQEQRNVADRARGEADQQLQRARRSIYALQLAKVAAVYQQDPQHGLRLLQDPQCCPPDLQDFSWGWLYRRCQPYRFSLGGPTTRAFALAPTPEGAELATLEENGMVRFWDLSSGRERAALDVRMPKAKALFFSPDGRTLALVDADQSVKLWNLTTQTEGRTLPRAVGTGRPKLAIAPDGKTLFTADHFWGVKRWDVASGQEKAVSKPAGVVALACAPDGQTLAMGCTDGTVRICDAEGQEQAVLKDKPGQAFHDLAYAPDGRSLAAVVGFIGPSGYVDVWDVSSRRLRFRLEPHRNEHFTSVAISSDGKRLAAGVALGVVGEDGGAVRLWELPTGRELTTFQGHKGRVFGVRFAPDGKTLFSASVRSRGKMELFVWDVLPDPQWATIRKSTKGTRAAAVTRDGRVLALGADDGTITLVDLATGEERATLQGHMKGITSLAFTPDGKTLASGARDSAVRIWEVPSGRQRHLLKQEGEGARLAFSPDGRTLAIANRNKPSLRFWDTVTGQEKTVGKIADYGVHCLAYAPDGQTLAVGATDGLKLWDVVRGQERASRPARTRDFGTDAAISMAFSPDGKRLAVGDEEGIVKVWELGTGQERLTWKAHAGAVTTAMEMEPDAIGFGSQTRYQGPGVLGLAFSPDGKTLASGGADLDYTWEVKLWDPITGQERATLKGKPDRAAVFVAFAPEVKKLLAVSGRSSVMGSRGNDPEPRSEVVSWEVAPAPEQVLARDVSGIGAFALSPDGQTLVLASGGDTTRVYELVTCRQQAVFPGSRYQSVTHVALTPDGTTVAVAGNNTVTLWDLASGRERARLPHADTIHALSLAPDGKTLATGGVGGATLWDMATGQGRNPDLRVGCVTALCFAPDNRMLAAGGLYGEVWLGDTSTGEMRKVGDGHTSQRNRVSRVHAVAFASDGKTVATASGDQTVKVWDVATGRERATLTGHAHQVLSVAFSPDGKRLASGGLDGQLRLWNTATGQLLNTWDQGSAIMGVTFTPDGKRLVWSNGEGGQVKIRDIPPQDKK